MPAKPSESLSELVILLNSPSAILREEAIIRACELPPEDLLRLVEETNGYTRQQRRWPKLSPFLIARGFNAIGVYVLLRVINTPGRIACIGAILFILFHWLTAQDTFLNVIGLDARLVARIVAVEAPEYFGVTLATLAQCTRANGDVKTRDALMKALRRQAQHLPPDVCRELTTKQKRGLLIPLRSPNYDMELTIALLRAVSCIEDEAVEREVSRLAHGVGMTMEPRIIAAARSCLLIFREREEERALAQTLLRGSAAEPAADQLLRAAHSLPDAVPAEQLLRASES